VFFPWFSFDRLLSENDFYPPPSSAYAGRGFVRGRGLLYVDWPSRPSSCSAVRDPDVLFPPRALSGVEPRWLISLLSVFLVREISPWPLTRGRHLLSGGGGVEHHADSLLHPYRGFFAGRRPRPATRMRRAGHRLPVISSARWSRRPRSTHTASVIFPGHRRRLMSAPPFGTCAGTPQTI